MQVVAAATSVAVAAPRASPAASVAQVGRAFEGAPEIHDPVPLAPWVSIRAGFRGARRCDPLALSRGETGCPRADRTSGRAASDQNLAAILSKVFQLRAVATTPNRFGCGSSSSSAQTSLCDGGEAGGSRVRQRVVVARKRRRDRCPTVLVPSATAGGFPLVLARFVESFSTHQSAGCPWPLEDRQSRTACRQALR